MTTRIRTAFIIIQAKSVFSSVNFTSRRRLVSTNCFSTLTIPSQRINCIVHLNGSGHLIIGRRNLSNKMGTTTEEIKKLVTIACVQLSCNEDKEKNFEVARGLIVKARRERGEEVIFLPEAFDFIGRSKEESARLSETLEGPLVKAYCDLAREVGAWLSLGGFHVRQTEMRENDIPWMTNNHLLIDARGVVRSVYRKVHLFDVVIPEDNVNLQESSFIKAGEEIVPPVQTPNGMVGLGICYDLRFPRFSSTLRSLGADILTYPSAFTVPTGQAHWETLLRARAIETQCFVVAAALTGQHNAKRASYGHSLIVDPWGKVLADGGKEVGLITAEIDLSQIAAVRKKMPVVQHLRTDLYKEEGSNAIAIPNNDSSTESFQFGHVLVNYYTVFLESRHARAFVNRKCVVPGHVLISSKRLAKKISDLSSAEVADMFCLAQKIQVVMESLHGASSSTMTVQDGRDAGQTVEHVHIHILPRKPNDFKRNDEIYERLGEHDKGEDIKWRDDADMIAECKVIREHIRANNLI